MKWWDFNPTVKHLASELSYLIYHKVENPILVASSGRSGSTMLCHAIMNSSFCTKYNCTFSPRMVFFSAFTANHQNFKKGGVYKSHLLSHRIPKNVKTIFIYDDPLITYKSFIKTLSIYGKTWGAQHLKNLESPYGLGDINNDVDYLNYANQVEAWMKRQKGVFIRFTSLWNNVEALNEYLGLDVLLPLKQERSSGEVECGDVSNTIDRLTRIYKSLPSIEFKL